MNDNDRNELLRKVFQQASLPANTTKDPSPDDTSHPVNDDELLIRWSLDDLEDGEHEQIVEHLADCRYCRRELAAMLRAGALTLPESQMIKSASGPIPPDTVPIHDDQHLASPNRRLLAVGAAIAATLLVAVIWGLSDQGGMSMVAMAQRDLEAGRHADAMERMEKYLDENKTLDAKDRTEAGRILEESGYRVARKEFTDTNGIKVDRVLAIEESVSRRVGSSARLFNLRLQAERGDNHELSLSSSGTLTGYGYDSSGHNFSKGGSSFPEITDTTKRLEKEFTDAVDKHPQSLDLRLNFGHFLMEQADLPAAVEQFVVAVEIDPNNMLAETGLGLALFQQGKDRYINQALTHFQRAVELSPQDRAANLNLAICLTRLGRKDEAKPYLQKAAE